MFAGFVRIFDRVVTGLATLGGALAAVALLAILALVGTEVVLRELFDRSTLVADEMSAYLNVALVYLGLAYTLREGGFIRVEPVYDRIAHRAGGLVNWIVLLVSLVYLAVVIWYMVRHARHSFDADIRSLFVSQTPLFWPQMLIPIGSAILALQLVALALRRVPKLP